MKSLPLLISVVALAAASSSSAAIYSGNGNSGFGGTLGGGSLNITDNGTDLNLTFARGANVLNDAVVIYIDSVAGGSPSTANFTDTADGLRIAISGNDAGANQTVAVFPVGFTADYAIAFDAGFGGLWDLTESGSHNFITSVNLSPSGNNAAASHSMATTLASLSLTPGSTFRFVATYISTTGFRSDEAIGGGIGAGNPGFTNGIAFTSSAAYTVVPEPSAALFLGLAGLAACRRRRA